MGPPGVISNTLAGRFIDQPVERLFLQTNGDTLLHIATSNKDHDLAKLLVQWGAPVDEQNVRICKRLVPACAS